MDKDLFIQKYGKIVQQNKYFQKKSINIISYLNQVLQRIKKQKYQQISEKIKVNIHLLNHKVIKTIFHKWHSFIIINQRTTEQLMKNRMKSQYLNERKQLELEEKQRELKIVILLRENMEVKSMTKNQELAKLEDKIYQQHKCKIQFQMMFQQRISNSFLFY